VPFITFEGIEGSGKSTQVRRLATALGERALVTQEPGGTALGCAIRALLLEPRGQAVAPATEMLLFFADRAQHVAERLRPALAAGRIVVSDRYTDSTLAYQGYGRGLPRHLLEAVAEVATGGRKPELTILLDVPGALGLGRVGRRGTRDRLEAEDLEFHERVREGYLALAAAEPDRYYVVDASRPPEIGSAEIVAEVRRRFHLEVA